MKKILLSLGLLFLLVGYALFNATELPVETGLPNFHQQNGVVSKIDVYKTSKFGEVFFFELEGIEARFWLKARLEKEPGLKEKLLQEIRKGDQLTAFYTSLEGTQYEYASAPFNVARIEKDGQTIDGLTFVAGKELDLFTKIMFYGMGSLLMLIGTLVISLSAWMWYNQK